MTGSTREALLGSRLRTLARRIRPEVSQSRLLRFLATHPSEPSDLAAKPAPTTIAVVIPCYGHARFLRCVADSLRNQTRSPDEIVFVDDHSPDETAQILADVAASLREATHADVSILTNTTNIGQSASLNRAIAATTSDIVLILNDDDYLVVDCVDLTMRLYKEFPEIALLGATCVPFSDDEVLESEAPSAAAGHGRESFDLAIHHPDEAQRFRHASQLNMTHSGSSFRRSAWLRVGGYNPDQSARIVRFSDRDFQMRVSALFPVGISEEVPFSFWRTDSSVDAGRNS